jgi:hypothetical protein
MKQRWEAWAAAHPRSAMWTLTLYYTLVVFVLIVMYGRGDFSTPPFLYQGF